MGNYKFRLSDMIPNSWFYKLRDMSKIKTNLQKQKHTQLNHESKFIIQPHLSEQRKSYYITRELNVSPVKPKLSEQNSPRKSPSRRRRSTKRTRASNRFVYSSVSAGCRCRARVESVQAESQHEEILDSPPDHTFSSSENENNSVSPSSGIPDTFDGMLSLSASCECLATKNDIVIDIDSNPGELYGQVAEFKHLPPIITKKQGQGQSQSQGKGQDKEQDPDPVKFQANLAEFPEKNACGSQFVKVVKQNNDTSFTKNHHIKRFCLNSTSAGMKLRTNSPRIGNWRIQNNNRKSISCSGSRRRSCSENVAVVKASKDPRRDFHESMIEMIAENNIRTKRELEELLAWYLVLNSDEYHGIIINVFKQIWFDYVGFRVK